MTETYVEILTDGGPSALKPPADVRAAVQGQLAEAVAGSKPRKDEINTMILRSRPMTDFATDVTPSELRAAAARLAAAEGRCAVAEAVTAAADDCYRELRDDALRSGRVPPQMAPWRHDPVLAAVHEVSVKHCRAADDACEELRAARAAYVDAGGVDTWSE